MSSLLRLEDISPHLDEGLLVLGVNRRVIYINELLAAFFNFVPGQVIDRPVVELTRQRDLLDLIDQSFSSPSLEPRDVVFTIPQETIWRVRTRPLAVNNDTHVLLAFRDVTTIRHLENVRKDFVANVSHELKTPLTSLRAALETLLETAWEDREASREFLTTAQHQVERLERLIDDLLTLSRLDGQEAIPREPGQGAPVQATGSRMVVALRPLAKKMGVTLRSDWPEEPLVAACTTDELTQILMNLLDNAIKFNRPDGTVTLSAHPKDGRVEIRVSDTGVGISPEHIPRLFERFYRVDKARSREVGGTGLGLSIVKHIVENRNGTVNAESEVGQGATFFVSLPSLSSGAKS